MEKLKICEKEDLKINWKDIMLTRYMDWTMTTPLMLLVLSLVLSDNIGKKVGLSLLLTIIFLNYIMLYIGYLGEIEKLTRFTACILGFIPFIGLIWLIFSNFVKPIFKLSNYIIFTIFTVIWSLYGIVYLLDIKKQNIALNILDCLSKCCFGYRENGGYSGSLYA
jgi:bacteriorhodopsin